MSDSDADRVKHPTLVAALHAVMGECGYVQKSKQAPAGAGGYRYASDADLIKAVRPAVLRHGVVGPMPVGVQAEDSVGDGKMKYRTSLIVRWRFAHVDSAETIEIETAGQGADNQDKSAYKAMTGAFKYALRETLMIETGDDPEADDGGDDRSLAPDTKAIESAFGDGAKAGRLWVIRQLYAKAGQDPEYTGRAFAAELKSRDLPSLEDVKMFCLWLGKPKPSHLDPPTRAKLFDWLATDKARALFDQFAKDCMEDAT